MGKPSKSRAKKNSASSQEGAEADGGSGVAEQPTTATTSTPPQGDADKVIRVYADGMCPTAVSMLCTHLYAFPYHLGVAGVQASLTCSTLGMPVRWSRPRSRESQAGLWNEQLLNDLCKLQLDCSL